MTRAPFDNSRVKLSRTRQLVGELDQIIASYDGARLVAEQVAPDHISITLRVQNHPADAIESILGDIIHNLRAALDLVAVTAVERNEGNPKGVHFPFAENEAGLEEQIRNKKFHRASEEAQDLLRSLKPFKGGNEALRAIHDLYLLDKHNDLIPTLSVGVQTQDLQFGGVHFSGNYFGLHDGLPLVRMNGMGAAIMAPVPLRLRAMFGAGQPFAREELVPALSGLADLVDGIVEAFAALYIR